MRRITWLLMKKNSEKPTNDPPEKKAKFNLNQVMKKKNDEKDY